MASIGSCEVVTVNFPFSRRTSLVFNNQLNDKMFKIGNLKTRSHKIMLFQTKVRRNQNSICLTISSEFVASLAFTFSFAPCEYVCLLLSLNVTTHFTFMALPQKWMLENCSKWLTYPEAEFLFFYVASTL
jgi:hypothetical protein